jgi:predicted dehydrogenase
MKQKQTSIHRRNFLATTTGAGLALSGLSAATPSRAASPAQRSTVANDTIRVGMIGPGGRGIQLLKECIEFGSTYKARVTAVCDIWNKRLEAAAKRVRESYSVEPKSYPNYEQVLADNDIDAVIIATPDHQHSKMLKAAVEAGKDVYIEKPMGNVLSELNEAFAAVEKSGRIVQIGTQRRSDPRYRSAIDIMNSGRIGEIVKVDVIWNTYSQYRWAKKQKELDSLKESDVDWKAFLMGKPDRPFDPKIYRSFRLFREFSSAIIDQWMTHGIDVVHMLTGELYPKSVVALGKIYRFHDYRENPDTMQAVLDYGHGGKNFLATYGTCLANGAGSATRVQGTRGTLEVENAWRISGDGVEGDQAIKEAEEIPEKPGTLHHMANWLDCVRRRAPQDLYCPAEAGYGHSIACIMTTDAMWSGRRMVFDPSRGEIREG